MEAGHFQLRETRSITSHSWTVKQTSSNNFCSLPRLATLYAVKEPKPYINLCIRTIRKKMVCPRSQSKCLKRLWHKKAKCYQTFNNRSFKARKPSDQSVITRTWRPRSQIKWRKDSRDKLIKLKSTWWRIRLWQMSGLTLVCIGSHKRCELHQALWRVERKLMKRRNISTRRAL